MNTNPYLLAEYGLMKKRELIQEAQSTWRECPSAAERLWQGMTERLERLTWSLGLRWRVAYAPACSRL